MYQPKSNLLEKVITLTDVDQNDNQFIIQDANGDKYSFFKVKKDGSSTQAASALMNLELGQTVTVLYDEKKGAQGGTFRNVAMIKDSGEAEEAVPAMAPASNRFQFNRTPAPAAPSTPTTQVNFPMSNKSELIGVLALIKAAGCSLADLEAPGTMERFVQAYRNLSNAVETTPTAAPVQHQSNNDGDISVEDIPFN